MKTILASSSIEPLEARIAPATLVLQAGQAGNSIGEIDYTDVDSAEEDAIFVNTQDNPADPISAVVGPGGIGPDTFYVKLTTNSLLKVFSNTGFQPLISGDVIGNAGITGNLVAFFVDKNSDNEVQFNELTGLALGKNVAAIVSGDVDGDVLTNFNDALNRLGAAAEPVGQAQDLLANPVANLVISGNVNGSVVSGGQINKLKVGGSIEQVLTGTAANGYAYDFNGGLADGGDTLVVGTPAAGVKGVSILNTSLGEVNRVQAGDGGAGAAGGALSKITIIADENGLGLFAGNGGAGTAGKTAGGGGGAVTGVIVQGLESGAIDETPNSLIEVHSGRGGDSFAGSAGVAGAGGLLQSVYVGFQEVAGKPVPQRSLTPLNDEVLVQAGDGGAGKTGGAGGAVKTVSLFASPTGAGNDLSVLGGNGGATNLANMTSKAGIGGAVSAVTVFNPSTDAAAHDAKIMVEGGDGGSSAVGGSGNAGGSVSTLDLIGYRLEVRAGDGSGGQKVGGVGGNLLAITGNESDDGVRPENVILDAGRGGVATAGMGGKGGFVSGVTLNNADLQVLAINQTAGAGDGGSSNIGAGAAGGLVTKIDVTEFDSGIAGQVLIDSGSGGQGGTGSPAGGNGGAAGAISAVTIRGIQLDLTVTGGFGGDALLKGLGGAGGAVSGLSFFSHKQQGGAEVQATINSGAGGDGTGTGKGGAGGEVKTVNVSLGRSVRTSIGNTTTALVDGGAILVNGGLGGNSAAAAAGVGGAISNSTFLTYGGAVTAAAGDAGAGQKASAGGRLLNLAIDNGTSATLSSGNGSGGGAGGEIRDVGISRAEENFPVFGTINAAAGPAPLGGVSVIAGNGSGAGTVAGVGGSIVDLTGFVGLSGATTVQAGDGGAVAKKSANGGNVRDVTLFGGGGAGVEVKVRAGDALAAASATTGGIGGSILGLDIGVNIYDAGNPANPDNAFALDPATIIRHIAAGNGGDTGLATGKGGKGGDIKNVNTHHDIGVRSGEGFGFDTMGGLFAGAGGINTTLAHDPKILVAKDGAAGSVLQVTADAIAAIVAGRPNNGDIFTIRNLATKVDDVILNGLLNPTMVDANGTYTNFAVANLIGGVVDPTAPGAPYPAPHPHANTFDLVNGEFVDNDASGEFSLGDQITAKTDGFIAAINFINTINNFRPEAVLTSIGGVVTFVDDTNGQATV